MADRPAALGVVDAGEEPGEWLLAAGLGVCGGVVVLGLQGWPELDAGLEGRHAGAQLSTRIAQAGPGALASRWSAVHNSQPSTSASAT
jgi:hypothetical protein